jgi:basic membrane protein A
VNRTDRRITWNKWAAIVVVTLMLVGLVSIMEGCSESGNSPDSPQRVIRVGMALGRGGLGDRSFSDSAYEGLQRAQREFAIRSHVVDFQEGTDQVANLRALVGENHDLVIVLGQEYRSDIETLAPLYPEQHFAIIDAQVEAPNVTSVIFRELEGDFLAGALAVLLSEQNTVGFLGGADIDIIRRIEHGWSQGVHHIKPEAKILVEYAGGIGDFSGFAKPELGRELTSNLYAQQADVVYAAAGRTALGAIDAAQQQHKLVITTGSDQRWIAPGVVVASRTKNMDIAVYTLLNEYRQGILQAGTRELDLKSGGVSLTSLDSALIPTDVREQVRQIQIKLINGDIAVQEYQAE